MASKIIVILSLPVPMVIYAITLEDWLVKVGGTILPLILTCMSIAPFLWPKDEGAGIKFLHLQFSFFAIISEFASSIGDVKQGLFAWYALFGISIFWLPLYLLGLKLRRKAAQLAPSELSDFLCKTVLRGGVGAMAPRSPYPSRLCHALPAMD